MGIRFFCPGCQDRMNVKSFLAGKRGICPKCDARFTIPDESDPKAEKSSAKKTALVGAEGSPPAESTDGKKRKVNDSAEPERKSSESRTGKSQAGKSQAGKSQAGKSPTSGKSQGGKSQGGKSQSDSERRRKSTGQTSASKPSNGTSRPAVDDGIDFDVEPSRPQKTPESPAASLTIPGATNDAARPSSPTPPATPPAATAHPTELEPSKVWYVRPRTGGEFGPADGPLMKRWIGEGRVAGDSLVWCEGWEDWKNAALVFTELDNHSPPLAEARPAIQERIVINDTPAIRTEPQPQMPAASIAEPDEAKPKPARNVRRKPARGKWTAAVVILAVVAVALVVILINVLSKGA